MPTRLRDATNTLRTIARVRVRDSTNTLRTVSRIRMRDATNTLRTVWQAVSSIVATATPVSSARTSSGAAPSGTVVSHAHTASASGGTAPYTYAWSYVSGDADMTPTAPALATTAFSATVFDNYTMVTTFKCTVSDSAGQVADTNTIEVTLFWANTT